MGIEAAAAAVVGAYFGLRVWGMPGLLLGVLILLAGVVIGKKGDRPGDADRAFRAFYPLALVDVVKTISLGEKFAEFRNVPLILLLGLAVAVFVAIRMGGWNIRRRSVPGWVPYAIAGFAAVFFTILSLLKHFSFYSTGFDLGLYTQVMEGLLHGKDYYGIWIHSHFGMHLEPILLFLVPAYAVFRGPAILLIIQGLVLGASVLPLYAYAKRKIGELGALLSTIAWLLTPTLFYTALFDFHPAAFVPLFLFLALIALEERKYGRLWIWLILIAMCKETFALIVAVFGGYIFLVQKERRQGTGMMLVGAGWFFLSLFAISPLFYSGPSVFLEMNSYFGSTFSEVVETVLFHPVYTLRFVFTLPKAMLAALLLVPTGFLALLAPGVVWIAASELFLVFLYNAVSVQQIIYHHTLVIAAVLVAAGVSAISWLGRRWGKKAVLPFITFLVLSSLAAQVAYGPFSILYDINEFNPFSKHAAEGREVLKVIPDDAPILAMNSLLPHVSARRHVYSIWLWEPLGERPLPEGVPSGKYLALDLGAANQDPRRNYDSISVGEALERIFENKDYGIVAAEGEWIVLQEGAPHSEGLCKAIPLLESREEWKNLVVGCPQQ